MNLRESYLTLGVSLCVFERGSFLKSPTMISKEEKLFVQKRLRQNS